MGTNISSELNATELKRLSKRFNKIDNDQSGSLTLAELKRIPGLEENPLLNRFFSIVDKDNNGEIDFQEFIQCLLESSISAESKLKFAFQIYDIDNDGFISKSELYQVLKLMTGNSLIDIQIKQLVNRTILYADKDKDGKISFDEFRNLFNNNDIVFNNKEINIRI